MVARVDKWMFRVGLVSQMMASLHTVLYMLLADSEVFTMVLQHNESITCTV